MKKICNFDFTMSPKPFIVTSANKWTEVYKNTNGDIEYIDFENIREIHGYIYCFFC